MTRTVILALAMAVLAAPPATAQTAADPEPAYACRQDIHPQDEDFPGVHVATLEEAPNGDLLYGFYAGTREGAEDVRTYMSRLARGSARWTAPEVVFDEPGKPDGNAVFWTDDENGRIHLLFSTIMGDGWTEANLRVITSDDNGLTWSEPTFIREKWGWLFGTLPFRMTNGDVMVPIYSETEWSSGFYISTDDGETYTPYPNDDDETWPRSIGGMIQPATVELTDGHLLALNRSRDGFIWKTESTDYGRTWSDAEPTTMPNNNSRVALLKLDNGNLVLAHNPTVAGRSPLRLSLSTDGGETWGASVDVESETGVEFSYPYLLQTTDGAIHLGYTHRRRSMRHLVFTEEFIRTGPDIPSNASYDVKAEYREGSLRNVAVCEYHLHGAEFIERVAGDTRVGTAVAVSERTRNLADTVLLASADGYADGLAAGPLAAKLDAPLLLTRGEGLDPKLVAEIERLEAAKVVIIGGTRAVPESVERDLDEMGLDVERVSGAHRFATAAAVAAQLSETVEHAFIVEGANADPDRGWPDAISAGPLAAHEGEPLLLVTRDELPESTAKTLEDLGVTRVTVIGGEGAVGPAVVQALEDLGLAVERISGPTRYATSAAVEAVAREAGLEGSTLWTATGRAFADALAAGPAVAQLGHRFLLIDGQGLDGSPETRDAAEEMAAELTQILLLGGEGAIRPETAAALGALGED